MSEKKVEDVTKTSEEVEKEVLQMFAKKGIELTQEELDELIFERAEYIRVESR